MKLVDILARELKAWPDNNLVDLSACFVAQDSDGMLVTLDPEEKPNADQFYQGIWARSHWTGGDLLLEVAEDYAAAIVTRAEWQAAVDALNAPKVVEWDEVGLPPVGLDVEIKRGNCTWIDGDEWQIGKTATVMASFLNSRDIEMASVQFPGGHCECILARCLSPIRTAEQVAAEEREKARTEVLNAMTANGKTANEPEALWQFRLKVVGEMLDMGYRKDTKPCGS